MAKNKFIITISDINGSKHFYLNKVIKKIFFYIICVVLVFFIFSILYIKYLGYQISDLNSRKDELISKSKELNAINEKMQKDIEKKELEYEAINDKIASLEEELGLEIENNLTINERLDNLKLNNEQQIAILTQIPNGYPIEYKGLTDNFGWRDHPILNKKEFHPGIDFKAELGTPIYATADGVVEFSGYSHNGYGQSVILLHNFGFKSVFAHMMRKNIVNSGQFVNKGELIGYSGNTGLSTGPHLHYEIRFVNKNLDPSPFLNLQRKNLYEFFNQERRVPWQYLIKAITKQYQKQQ